MFIAKKKKIIAYRKTFYFVKKKCPQSSNVILLEVQIHSTLVGIYVQNIFGFQKIVPSVSMTLLKKFLTATTIMRNGVRSHYLRKMLSGTKLLQ